MCNFSLDRTQPRGYLSFPSLPPSLSLSPNQPGVGLMLSCPPTPTFLISSFHHRSSIHQHGVVVVGGGPSRLPTLSFWTCLKLYGRKAEVANKYQTKIEKWWAGMHHQSCVNDEDPSTHTRTHMRAASKQQCMFGALM